MLHQVKALADRNNLPGFGNERLVGHEVHGLIYRHSPCRCSLSSTIQLTACPEANLAHNHGTVLPEIAADDFARRFWLRSGDLMWLLGGLADQPRRVSRRADDMIFLLTNAYKTGAEDPTWKDHLKVLRDAARGGRESDIPAR